jgi:hypothetical protein
MPDLESTIRDALYRRLRLARVESVQTWDDEVVARITAAAEYHAGLRTGQVLDTVSVARAAELGALAAEMLATFTKGSNGCSARVKQDQVDQWRARLGAPGAPES